MKNNYLCKNNQKNNFKMSACFGTLFQSNSFPSLLSDVIDSITDEDLIEILKNCKTGSEMENKLNRFVLDKFEIHDHYFHYKKNMLIIGMMIEEEDTEIDLLCIAKRAETIRFILTHLFDDIVHPRVRFMKK